VPGLPFYNGMSLKMIEKVVDALKETLDEDRTTKENRVTGQGVRPGQFCRLGRNVVFERGVLVFHPENIEIGENVYIGHATILKGYYKNKMIVGDHTWIGAQCFLHSAGGLRIGRAVGIGPK